ncbi:MAG TPA: ATP synthase F0 subunit B [Bacteroidales bacterium]|nr:ATP synthase F0 subunit B [Bacteroidales bacterium]
MELVTPGIGILFWMLLSFSVVLFILGKFAWKPILNSLKERENSIDEALSSAQKAKEEMSKIKSENEVILAEAAAQRDKMLKEAKDIKEQIIRDAKELATGEATKLIENAKVEIENQKLAALAEIKNVVASLSVDIAEKVIGRELENKSQQMAYIEDSLKKINLNK